MLQNHKSINTKGKADDLTGQVTGYLGLLSVAFSGTNMTPKAAGWGTVYNIYFNICGDNVTVLGLNDLVLSSTDLLSRLPVSGTKPQWIVTPNTGSCGSSMAPCNTLDVHEQIHQRYIDP